MGVLWLVAVTVTPADSAGTRLSGSERFDSFGGDARAPSCAVMIGQALARGFQTFRRYSREDSLLGHDKPIALVQEVIPAKLRRGHVDRDEICAGSQTPAITVARLSQV